MEEASDPGKEKQKTGFPKQLASCDKTTRDRAVRLLESWMTAQNNVTIQDLKKIWKGLFYCVWHADKRHIQAEVIEKLASPVRTLDLGLSKTYFQVFILTMRREWSGIDHLRLDKFYLMLRRFLHYVFLLLDSHGWEKSVTESFMMVLTEETLTVSDKYAARGINLQFVDVYLSELKEFLPLKGDVLGFVFEPLYCVLGRVSDRVLVERVKGNVFDVLLDYGKRLVKKRVEERDNVNSFASEPKENKEKEGDNDNDNDDEVEKLGFVALALGIGNRVLELATAELTPQANRRVLYALHEEFGKLEKFYEVSEVSIFVNGVRRDIVSEDTGNKKKKANLKKVKRALDGGSQQGNVIMEVVEKECLEKQNKVKKRKTKKAKNTVDEDNQPVEIAEEGKLKKVKKGKLKKLKAGGDGKQGQDNGQDIGQKGSLEMSDVMKKTMKKKVKKARKEKKFEKGEEDEDSNVGIVSKKKLKGSSELREKKKSHMKERTCEVDEAVVGVIGNGVHNNQSNGLVSDGVSFELGNSVISNLQRKFEKVATELGENMEAESSLNVESLATSSSFESKKRKRAKNFSNEVISSHENVVSSGGSPCSKSASSCSKMGEKSVKKVRFSLTKNIVWKPTTPLPPESLRMPPSSTPRGSALKKGVPPGPIRIVKESPTPQRMRILTLSMRKGKRKLKVTPGTKMVRKRQSNVLLSNSV